MKAIAVMMILGFVLGLSAAMGALFRWGWNLLVAANTSLPELSFWQAWGVYFLLIVMLGSKGGES